MSTTLARQQRPGRRGPDATGPGPSGPAGRGPAGKAGRRPGPAAPPTDRLDRLATGFVQAFLEVEAGRRPRQHLEPVLCPTLVERLADVWVRPGPPGLVVRVRGLLVAETRYEAVAVVRRGRRFGAVAVTLVRYGQAWRVLDAGRPEDGRTTAGSGVLRLAPPALEG